MLDILCKKTVD